MTFQNPLPEYERRSAIRVLREYKQSHLGTAELAQICGVTRQCVSNWRKRGKAPPADHELHMGPVWNRQTILNWLNLS